MKNTNLDNFRFESEIIPYDYYNDEAEWNPSLRSFIKGSFSLFLCRSCGNWVATLGKSLAFAVPIIKATTNAKINYKVVNFIIPDDRAALRLIRMFEKHDLGTYLKTVCKTPNDIPTAVEGEWEYMVKKIENFCHTVGGSRNHECNVF